ncbi:MAG: vWA domain-containing protein [Actinomycetes bacterium]
MSTEPTTPTGGETAGPTPVHLYVLIDESGSMASMRTDVVGGFNELIRSERDDTAVPTRVTLAFFDSQEPCRVVTRGVPVAEISELDDRDFRPRGGTPLLDATAHLITLADTEVADRRAHGLPDESIVFVTITDGFENASHEFDRDTLRTLIEQRQADGWEFRFIAADLEAFADARTFGYRDEMVVAYRKSGVGMRHNLAGTTKDLLSTAKMRNLRDFEDRRRDRRDGSGA